jgi:hypothetical protein
MNDARRYIEQEIAIWDHIAETVPTRANFGDPGWGHKVILEHGQE